jgi:hypothetical protein
MVKQSTFTGEIRLYRLTVTAHIFRTLSRIERLFLLRFAHVHNDMRHIQQLVGTANNGIETLSGIDQKIALHQHLFAVRLWCGALAEANDVIASGWNGSGLAARLHYLISAEAKTALRGFLDYFNRPNSIRTVRRQFAFHYDPNPIAQEDELLEEFAFEFVTGIRSGNIFYDAAETIRSNALFRSVEPSDLLGAPRKLYGELIQMHDRFMTFSHSVFLAIVEEPHPTTAEFMSKAVSDPAQAYPIIFVDEDAVGRRLAQRGVNFENETQS